MKSIKRKRSISKEIIKFVTCLFVAYIAFFLAMRNVYVALAVFVFLHTLYLFDLKLKVLDIEKEINELRQTNLHIEKE
jgi:hypothetical protein